MKYSFTYLALLLTVISSCAPKPTVANQEADHREAIIYQKGEKTVIHDVGTDELIVLQTENKLQLEKPVIVIQTSKDLIVLHTGPDKKVQRFKVSEEVIGIALYENQKIIDEIIKTTKEGSKFIPSAVEEALKL